MEIYFQDPILVFLEQPHYPHRKVVVLDMGRLRFQWEQNNLEFTLVDRYFQMIWNRIVTRKK